jgi:transcriptional regulator with XRE-family HTH domain/tetratricopeptide (TPR) repeat protein
MTKTRTPETLVTDSALVRFGAELRRLRTARSLSLRALGEQVVCSLDLIHKIEHGDRYPNLQLTQRCDGVLDAGGALLRMWPEVDMERQATDQRYGPRRAAAVPDTPPAPGPDLTATSDHLLSQRLHHLTAGGLASPDAVAGLVDDVRYLVDELLDDGRPDRSRLVRLEARVDEHGHEALTVPPADMLGHLGLTMLDAKQLSRVRGRPVDRRRLYTVLARLAVLTADQLTELGHWAAAATWYTTAAAAADASADHAVRADVRALAAILPLHHGQPAAAVHAARRALALAGQRTCLATVLAPMVQAQGLAQLGRSAAARRAFAQARDGFARTSPGYRAESVFGFAPRRLLFAEGRLHTELGEYDLAWQTHQQALRLYPEEVVDDRAMIYLDRAVGLVHSGHPVDGAELVITTVLSIPEPHRGRLVLRAARTVLDAVPFRAQRSPAVHACHRLLADLDAQAATMAAGATSPP